MRSLVVRIVPGLIVVAGLLFLTACGGGGSSTTTATEGTSTSLAVSTTAESSTSSTSAPSSSTTKRSTSTTTSSSTTSTTLPRIIPGVPTVSHTDTKYGFSFQRPKDTTFLFKGFEAYLPLTKTPLVAVILPPALFKKTNLVEAGVYIGVSSAPAVTAKWKVPVSGSGEVAKGTTAINGATFAVFTSSQGAAGSIYAMRTYRTVHKGVCFEITELLHSSELGNYTPGTVAQFDKVKFNGYLEAIVDTFAFK
jgi:hypothetical protein